MKWSKKYASETFYDFYVQIPQKTDQDKHKQISS